MQDLKWYPYPDHSDPVLFDARGQRRTGSLFMETTQDNNRVPVLSLRDYDAKYPSAYQLYMLSADEYDAAMRIVGSMAHWRKLMNCSWFMTGNPDKGFAGLHAWRQDMQARDASTAKRVLDEKVRDGDRQAAQFLLTYATKGQAAGLKATAQKNLQTRRGSQNKGDVIDLDAAFAKLQDGEN